MHIISNRCVHLPTTHRGVASIHPVSAQASPPPSGFSLFYFEYPKNAAIVISMKNVVFAHISPFCLAVEHN